MKRQQNVKIFVFGVFHMYVDTFSTEQECRGHSTAGSAQLDVVSRVVRKTWLPLGWTGFKETLFLKTKTKQNQLQEVNIISY